MLKFHRDVIHLTSIICHATPSLSPDHCSHSECLSSSSNAPQAALRAASRAAVQKFKVLMKQQKRRDANK